MPSQQFGSPREPHVYFANPQEVAHWLNVLNCTEEQLRAAALAVGTHIPTIRHYLKFRQILPQQSSQF
ncbi:DUF3606 domain-containing protein [Hymenobacter sp. RP-2-7]|uniref:DUF3606 domain-containing protein n=1 Tax=Hymenobacter polaris TaxID=2682546 RepID=A0A7Y0FMF5_9BACT|nr:DUF3606 domain-containing protein [Hymenobacter polaris]NML65476.1 DUF3606 domain-containing protein [Hymenobacter polaris]